MSKINWELVDRELFQIHRHDRADRLAEAYAFEAHKVEPSATALTTFWELGQGRFSEKANNRQHREALFRLFVAKANSAYVLSDEALSMLNA